MASPTTILPILLLLTFSTLSLTSPDQPSTSEQAIASLASASPSLAATDSSIPTSTLLSSLSSYSNNLASAPVAALITGLHDGAASSSLFEKAGLVKNELKPTLKGYQGSTITVAQSTRTIMTNRLSSGTGASTGMPSKSTNGTGMMMSISSPVRPVGNATVLPPEPIFTTEGPKSEAGRDVGRGMGMGMGVLVVVGLWVCGFGGLWCFCEGGGHMVFVGGRLMDGNWNW